MYTFSQYEESANYLKSLLGDFKPDVLLMLGSGLGYLADEVENGIAVKYGDIPHFKTSTAPGHAGKFVFGKLSGKNVAVMQGRFHLYEGYEAEDVVFPIRVAKLLGVSSFIVTNACGGVNLDYHAGDLMIIKDHIKLFHQTPLTGPNHPEFGVRFPDMSDAYTAEYRELAKETAKELNLPIREGVYCYFPGPQYETAAEVVAARTLGADTTGMSTVPEVIAANHCGLKTLGVSLVTNMATGVLPQKLSEQEVIDAAKAAAPRFSSLILNFLKKI